MTITITGEELDQYRDDVQQWLSRHQMGKDFEDFVISMSSAWGKRDKTYSELFGLFMSRNIEHMPYLTDTRVKP